MIALPEGSFALVTGASAGIGEALARSLARRKVPQVLVARSAERLEALAAEAPGHLGRRRRGDRPRPRLRRRRGAALRRDGGRRPARLSPRTNAGFGYYGPQSAHGLERTLRMLRLNVAALVEAADRFLAPMRARHRGLVLNVASTAGLPARAVHGRLRGDEGLRPLYSHALHEELKGSGVVVTALCPGTTRTDFHASRASRRASASASRRSPPRPSPRRGCGASRAGRRSSSQTLLDSAWIFTGRLVPRSVPPRIGAAVFSRLKRAGPV